MHKAISNRCQGAKYKNALPFEDEARLNVI
jgi:hypothetical protein